LANSSDSLSFRRCIEAFIEGLSSEVPSKKVKKLEKKEERETAFRLISLLWNEVIEGRADSLWKALVSVERKNSLFSAASDAFKSLADLYNSNSDIEIFTSRLEKFITPWKKIDDFLTEASAWVDLFSSSSGLGQGANLRLMTFQSAKGLEAKVVCVIGLEDSVIPREGEDENLPEQSRLLFVSMTRAINELHLFHARKRAGNVIFKKIYNKAGEPPGLSRSRFLNAIPKNHCEACFHKAY
jgi:superfamily I DNA/RNA helicase